MKSKLTYVAAITFILMTVSLLAAQEKPAIHHHYQLIDLGTLGGPQSFQIEEEQPLVFAGAPATRMINSRGAVTGVADLNVPDPYAPFCLTDCNVAHAFLWKNGEMTDLGALPGINDSFPNWINDRGELAGASYNGVDPASGAPLLEAVLWKEGSVIDLGDLQGGNQSIANGLNDRGDVVGAAVNATPDPFPNLWGAFLFFNNLTEPHAVLWRDGAITDLGTLGGPDSLAIFVNNSGEIAGQSLTDSVVNPSTGQPTQHPFLWQKGKMIDLGTLGGTLGFSTGLNNRGQVIGLMNIAGDVTFHGFLWDRGSTIDMGTLGGARSLASWINDSGEVLGISNMPGDQSWHGFVWKNGVKTDIGTLDGDPCSDPNVLNARGQAVGFTTDCHHHVRHTFLWENGSIVDLQSLVSPASQITINDNLSINDRGEITAAGSLPNGDTHSLLLVPCDEGHPGIEDCDYSLVHASTAAQAYAQVSATASENNDRPIERLEPLNGRLTLHRGLAGVRSPNK
jgi:probable HAF family extracellular repeat protein